VDGYFSNESSIIINVSHNEQNKENGTIWLTLNGELQSSASYQGANWTVFNLTGLMSGTYIYAVYINDSYGNTNSISQSLSVQLKPWWNIDYTARKKITLTNNEIYFLP
jgi:hypothetical protein